MAVIRPNRCAREKQPASSFVASTRYIGLTTLQNPKRSAGSSATSSKSSRTKLEAHRQTLLLLPSHRRSRGEERDILHEILPRPPLHATQTAQATTPRWYE